MTTLGLDVGGTKLLGVVLDERGEVLAEHRVPTPERGDELLDALADMVDELRRAEGVDVEAVGVGLPGLVDRAGTLRFAPNLPGIVELPAARILAERTGTPVRVENDATCAAWAEYRRGAAAGADDAVVLTLGTGIGGGIVLDGRLIRGASGFAGEIGHMVVDADGLACSCGRRGCWERYASGTALGLQARDLVAAGGGGRLVELAGSPEGVTGEHVTAAALAGDAGAIELLDRFADWFALGLANLVHVLDVTRCVVGGGLVEAGDVVLEPIRAAFAGARLAAPEHRPAVEIVPAALGSRAGAIGAALLATSPQPG